MAGTIGFVAQGSFGMLADEVLPVHPSVNLSKAAVPDEQMEDFQELANSAAFYSTTTGVFSLNGVYYKTAVVDGAVKVTPITHAEFANLQPMCIG